MKKALMCGLLFAMAAPASAQIITRTYDFEFTNFVGQFDITEIAPIDPVIGSISVAYERSVTVHDQIAGITLNHINLAVDGDIGYNYLNFSDYLQIGGTLSGVDTVKTGTNDFTLLFFPASRPAQYVWAYLRYSQDGQSQFYSHWATLSVQRSPSLPEPTSWALMLLGFGAVGVTMRRRSRALI